MGNSNNTNCSQQKRSGAEYYLFIAADEKLIYQAGGVLDNLINGTLILTSSKLFFYFQSNISRDSKFIATYPYIMSAELKHGLAGSALIIESKKETFVIKKMNKKQAIEFCRLLNDIITKNSTLKTK